MKLVSLEMPSLNVKLAKNVRLSGYLMKVNWNPIPVEGLIPYLILSREEANKLDPIRITSYDIFVNLLAKYLKYDNNNILGALKFNSKLVDVAGDNPNYLDTNVIIPGNLYIVYRMENPAYLGNPVTKNLSGQLASFMDMLIHHHADKMPYVLQPLSWLDKLKFRAVTWLSVKLGFALFSIICELSLKIEALQDLIIESEIDALFFSEVLQALSKELHELTSLEKIAFVMIDRVLQNILLLVDIDSSVHQLINQIIPI